MDLYKSKLGMMRLEGFMNRPEVNFDKFKIAAIGLGQAGGKMAAELSRIGIPTIIINTAESDLDDIKTVPQENKILLPGFGGASKDISRGLKAVNQNIDIVGKALTAKEIVNADFVWVFVGLGGGTGVGGLPTIIEGLGNIRKKKQFRQGHPTFGVFAAIPGSWEQWGLKENAVAGLSILKDAIDRKAVGNVVPIENEKLYEDCHTRGHDDIKWDAYGNTTAASLLIEISSAIMLPSPISMDKAELLEQWSTPGFASFGKLSVTEDENIGELASHAFKTSGVFADGYNLERDGKLGSFIAIKPRGRYIRDGAVEIQKALKNVMPNARKTHSGVIDNTEWKGSHDRNAVEKCLIYTMSVVETFPARVQHLVEEVEQSKENAKSASADREKDTNASAPLTAYKSLYAVEEESEEDEVDMGNFGALFGVAAKGSSKDSPTLPGETKVIEDPEDEEVDLDLTQLKEMFKKK